VERGVTTQRGWLQDSTTNLVIQWSISRMSTAKKVGGINEYEINSISAGNIEIYISYICWIACKWTLINSFYQ